MGPVFEHGFVDALGLTQIGAPIAGDPGPENMVVAALDDVDGVDLHIAEMFNGGGGRLRALAERRRRVEPLGAEPDPPGLGPGQGNAIYAPGTWCANVAGFAGPSRGGFFYKACGQSSKARRRKKKPRHPRGSAAEPLDCRSYFAELIFWTFM